MRDSVIDIEAARWGDEYRRRHHLYVEFADRLSVLLGDLLAQAGLEVLQVEARAKSVDGFLEKLGRKRARYTDPLSEITDLVGLRVITYYREDVVSAGALIREEFTIDEANSINKTEGLATSEFGYTGVHYVIALNDQRRRLAEWTRFTGMNAEIQVRTLAQHAWAAVDHKLNYKARHEIPEQLRRRFAALSAMFEVADDRFSELRREHQRLDQMYSEYLRAGRLDFAVNRSSLAAYLADPHLRTRLTAQAVGLGWTIREAGLDPVGDSADRRDLAEIISATDVQTIEQVDQLLSQGEVVERELRGLAPHVRRAGFPLEASLDDIVAMVLARHLGASSKIVRRIWSGAFAGALLASGEGDGNA